MLKEFASNPIAMHRMLDSIYRKPFDLVAEGLRSSIWLPG